MKGPRAVHRLVRAISFSTCGIRYLVADFDGGQKGGNAFEIGQTHVSDGLKRLTLAELFLKPPSHEVDTMGELGDGYIAIAVLYVRCLWNGSVDSFRDCGCKFIYDLWYKPPSVSYTALWSHGAQS